MKFEKSNLKNHDIIKEMIYGNYIQEGDEEFLKEKSIIVRDYYQIIENLEPYYTNEFFYKKARTVFLERSFDVIKRNSIGEIKGFSYVYDDRIYSRFDGELIKKAEEKSKKFNIKTAAYYQELLRCLYKNPNLKLIQIMVGINHSNCYPYKVFGFDDKFNNKNKQKNSKD